MESGSTLRSMTLPATMRAGRRWTERRLVAAARRGDPDAREAIVRDHWHETHRAAFLVLGDHAGAEDVAQEALLAALRSLGRFDGRSSLQRWIHRIAINRALDRIRAERARPRAEVGTDPERIAADPPPTQPTDIAEALADLSPDDRALVVLRYVLGHRAAEIAEELGVPPATVRSRLHRARVELRRLLGQDHQEGGPDG